MDLIHTIPELRARLAREQSVAFVPTMGNLHQGHIRLVDIARRHGQCVVVSIFVNPLQFAAGGDFDRYPRTLAEDCEKLAAAGTDVVFAPDVEQMYPEPLTVIVKPPDVAKELEGEHRPGHFAGMATVVLKLFNMVQPQTAVFGQKDYQQLAVVRDMVRQLNLPVEIIGADTVRAPDGLALSSRNGYLSPAERNEATRIYRHLDAMRAAIASGQRDFAALESEASSDLAAHGWRVDYVAVRNQRGLTHPDAASKALVILVAAWLGTTRLIDNIEVDLA